VRVTRAGVTVIMLAAVAIGVFAGTRVFALFAGG